MWNINLSTWILIPEKKRRKTSQWTYNWLKQLNNTLLQAVWLSLNVIHSYGLYRDRKILKRLEKKTSGKSDPTLMCSLFLFLRFPRFFIIYWTPTVKINTKDNEQWCTDESWSGHFPRMMSSLYREGTRHTVQLFMQTNQNNCCLLSEAQILSTPCISGFLCCHAKTVNIAHDLRFFLFTRGRLVGLRSNVFLLW